MMYLQLIIFNWLLSLSFQKRWNHLLGDLKSLLLFKLLILVGRTWSTDKGLGEGLEVMFDKLTLLAIFM